MFSYSVTSKSRFEKGEVYGQELLSINFNETRSESTRDVKCESKVEAFALTVDKLKNIAGFLKEVKKAYEELTTTKSNKMNHIEKEEDLDAEVDLKYLFSIRLPVDIEWDIKEHFCMSTLSKVPVLKSVGEDMLHHICLSLEPVILTQNNNVFKPGDEIDQMLIIVNGEIVLIERTIGHGQREQPNVKRVNKGDFFGEKVLMSAFPYTSISNSRPAISHEYVECCTKVEAFALTKESATTFAKGLSRSITIINQKLDSLIQLQSDMFQQQGQRLDKMAEFLDRLG
ncbi:hypothetical protein M0R45_015433 [Rubus argutus]|uniref:Cyclic nucleotide-binding domain-containing protein n=1 Tax=Rubus argutus TaxID=59490 RepID=A0AAW1XQV8_RUBAR